MNLSINLPELDQTDEHTKEHRAALGCWDIIHICAAPISMVLPSIICLLLKENIIRYSIFSKLAIVLPLLYSGIHYLILFNKNRTEQSEPPHTALYSLRNITLFLLFATSFIFIILLSVGRDDKIKGLEPLLSLVLLPLLVLLAYMSSTSCSFTRSNFQYTTTGTVDILLDLLILLSTLAPIAGMVSDVNFIVWTIYFITALPVLILIRSWREKYLPSAKYNGPAKPWRVAIPIIIFLIAIITYIILGICVITHIQRKTQKS
ncbi:DUF2463 domain-containing protein [Encephalitozoon hellem]|uniref:DUF2463 domain-containing protein n=1 Tax=Encephalitozoon hellem TaxID=27973 RepID=A0A9Q9C1T9_ENCHE|nr:DUF2463 domain-containing protein [Encephalitozoon hellem]UTX43263.1 DUF2463 domain-containing protein [Encephalitozoon hellem]